MAKATTKDKTEEPPASRGKHSSTAATASSGRSRKAANSNKDASTVGSSTTKAASANHANAASSAGPSSSVSPWSTAPIEVLHTYRSFHRLKTPAAFHNPHSHHILGHGIGRQTPTAAGLHKDKRRAHRESLSMAVRKHFNASAINENDAIVNTLYRARTGEKSLRLKFLPITKQR